MSANDCLSSIEHSLVMPLNYEFYYHKIYNSSRHLYFKNLEHDNKHSTGEISNQRNRVCMGWYTFVEGDCTGQNK